MKTNIAIIIMAIILSSCTPLTYIDGTMLDDFTTTPEPESKVEKIEVDGDDWELHYSIDGYRIDNVEIIGVITGGDRINITDKVTFVASDNESVTISYGGCTAELPIKSGESIEIYIDPGTIYYNFYMPDEFPEDDDVFVGWESETGEVQHFPIVNYSKEDCLVIHPLYRKTSEVFTLNGTEITGTAGTLYEFYGIPSSITAIEKSAFARNKTVKAIAFEKDSSITEIRSDTFYFSGLEYIEIPSSVTAIRERAFDGASNLKEVIFEENSKLESIGSDAFSVLTMTEFTIPNSVKTIGRSAFGMDVYLEKVTFEKGTMIESIDQYAFDNDFSLKTIEFIDPAADKIPDNVETSWGAPMSPQIIWDGETIAR